MERGILEWNQIFVILCGIVMGTAARIVTLKVDARQSPSYPGGVFINLVTGFIAACLGAVAIPALISRNFTAVTFLTVAVQSFREIRRIEVDSLTRLENMEYTSRGPAYIDGIAKTYEARNYISLITALCTVFVLQIMKREHFYFDIVLAVLTGTMVIIFLYRFTKGKQLRDVASVTVGDIEIKGSELYVDGLYVTNVLGASRGQELFKKEGMAFVIHPNQENDRLTLESYGQRQAVLFEAVRSFGVKRYQFNRRSFETGKIVIAFVPIVPDKQGIMDAILNTPILESSRKIEKKER